MNKCVNCKAIVPDRTGFGVCLVYAPNLPNPEDEYAVICNKCGNGKSSEEMLAMVSPRITQKAIQCQSQRAFSE